MEKYIKERNIKENSILKLKPELWYEWDFKKNNELGLDIWSATKGSEKYAWWICPKCKSSYKAKIYSRMVSNCPYCASQKVNHTNSLASLRSDIAKQWHSTKNGDLTPHDVSCGSDNLVWWICDKNHEWRARVSDRTKNKGCPYCSNKKVLKGFNDLWTTHSHIAKMLANPEDGYKYTYGSKKKVDWICECKNIVKNLSINKVCDKGVTCQICSDGFSYPEKIMYNILTQLEIEFETQKVFDWAKNKRYDFYLPQHNLIIETHGMQHKTSNKEKENDKQKRELAKNNLKTYVEIDCEKSELNYIKNSLLKSELTDIFDFNNVDWEEASLSSMKSKVVEVCNYYNNNKHTTHKKMSKLFKIEEGTIRSYLKRGSEVGLCNYTPNGKRSREQSTNHLRKKVVQLSKDGVFIRKWNSIKDAGDSLGKKYYSSISACCKKKAKTAYGYKWMYLEDFEKQKQQN